MYRIISWTAVLLWMILIFSLSSQAAGQSNKLSKSVAEIIVYAVRKVAPKADFDVRGFNHIMRKNAHFFAYFILGVLILYTVRRSGLYGYKSIGAALLLCILYAVSDEVHQAFVPGRGPGVKDVFIDSAGASIGIIIYMIAGKVIKQ